MYLHKKLYATTSTLAVAFVCYVQLNISACKKCDKHENVSTTYSPKVGEKWKYKYYDTFYKNIVPTYFMISGIDSIVKDTTFYRLSQIVNFDQTTGNLYNAGNILKYDGGVKYISSQPQHDNMVDFHLIQGLGINQSIPIRNWQWETRTATSQYVAYHATKTVNGIEYKNVEEFKTTANTLGDKIDIHQFFNEDHLMILQEGYHELAGLGLQIELSLVEHRMQ
jgi:hypothetical protein